MTVHVTKEWADLVARSAQRARLYRAVVRAGTWERIARRRAEVIATLQGNTAVDKAWLATMTRALEGRNERYHHLLAELEQKWGRKKLAKFLDGLESEASETPDHTCTYVVDDSAVWHPCAVCGMAKPEPDDSGRETPQAWSTEQHQGPVYRVNNGQVEFWRNDTVVGPGWYQCGPVFATIADVQRFHREQSGMELVKVPSPDCRNCDARGCMDCVLRTVHGDCADDCPTCCGG